MDLFESGYVVRDLETEDIEEIVEFEEENSPLPWTYNSFLGELYKDSYALVLEKEGEIAGYAVCWQVLDEFEVGLIAINKNFRGEGLGQKFMVFLIELALENNCELVNLEVRESNIPAIKLYKKLGFEVVGLRKNYYANNENALLMTLELTDEEEES
ncbi:ribosomal protein S18-alanine N-acetyltransferase [bacterium]|nr:ribosomal protein S18-alanine N-acetyltransferase [bacterium]